jgi:hypothetical protein
LAIPVFVRSRDEKGREFLEFATALNISAGGMLVAVMRAKMLRMSHTEGYHLLGLKFSRPLLNHRVTPKVRERKVASGV